MDAWILLFILLACTIAFLGYCRQQANKYGKCLCVSGRRCHHCTTSKLNEELTREERWRKSEEEYRFALAQQIDALLRNENGR